MKEQEFEFKGFVANGFFMLFFNLMFTAAGIASFSYYGRFGDWCIIIGIVILITTIFIWRGIMKLEPNEARAMVFFGSYKGTFRKTGFFWVNPFLEKKKLSFRARNLNVEPIKVNDKVGNPILIGLVLVWRLKDSYKALFEIDSQTMVEVSAGVVTSNDINSLINHANRVNVNRMGAFENFVRVQSDAALRQVASLYAYDNSGMEEDELTLRSGGDEVNEQLVQKLNERLAMAGMEVVEARINYLAYAPEIAAVMLRRQQASAIIMAREKIVEGAVSMVKMALDKIEKENMVELDEEKKAAMVSNLLVVLCADEAAQPVLNTGTLNH